MRSISTTLITLTVAALVATTVPDAEAPTKLPESTRDLEGAVGARCDTATAADEALTRLGGRHVAVFIRPRRPLCQRDPLATPSRRPTASAAR
jgi:hypothetical protein